jgi:hypothetical protein
MKIVSINSAPKVCDAVGAIRPDVTSLDAIVNNIDTACGRNDALKAYVYALRDLQVANNNYCFSIADTALAKIDQAQAAVARAFDALIVAEFALNRPATVEHLRDDL